MRGPAGAEAIPPNLPYNGEEIDRLVVAQVDGATILPEWISEDLGSDVGQGDSLLVGDVAADGDSEIRVNAGSIGHLIFGVVPPSGLIFSDGFEDGNASARSAVAPWVRFTTGARDGDPSGI